MTSMRFTNGRILTKRWTYDDVRIEVEAGRIVTIERDHDVGGTAIDLEGGWLLPGFIDTQVNGGGGILFNDETSVEGIRAIGAAHARYGTTGFLPTLISDDLSKVALALDAADSAIENGVPGVLGVHIEGPFLNVARKGIHDASKFRRLDPEAMALLTRPRRGRVMITLAPELCDTADIRALTAAGVIVSAGHSNADHDTTVEALRAGLTGFTHLFNAMSPLQQRAPGMVGAALDDRNAYCGIIVDGAHVHPTVLRIAMRAKPANRLMLVTDAMPSVGAVEKDFVLQGTAISVANGICVDAMGTLAGSDLDMAQAVRNLIVMTGADVHLAADMAAANPAAFLGLSSERGAIAEGLLADWVWLDPALMPRATWIGGRMVAASA